MLTSRNETVSVDGDICWRKRTYIDDAGLKLCCQTPHSSNKLVGHAEVLVQKRAGLEADEAGL